MILFFLTVLNLRWLSHDLFLPLGMVKMGNLLPSFAIYIWAISEFWTVRIATIRVHQGFWTSHGRSSPVNPFQRFELPFKRIPASVSYSWIGSPLYPDWEVFHCYYPLMNTLVSLFYQWLSPFHHDCHYSNHNQSYFFVI